MADYYGNGIGTKTGNPFVHRANNNNAVNNNNNNLLGQAQQTGPAQLGGQVQQQQQQQQQQSGGGGNSDSGKIFVGGLSWQTTEESLRWHFEQYGTVLSTEIMRDRNTGDPRGFGFVVFADPSTVDLVMQEDRHEVNHKIVDVKRAQARGIAPPSIHQSKPLLNNNNNTIANTNTLLQQPPTDKTTLSTTVTTNSGMPPSLSTVTEMTPEQAQTKVFVGGIPPHVDRDELRDIFSQFGPVMDTVVMMDPATQRSRCFGFVTFQNGSDGAAKAVEAQPLQIHGRRVEVKLATPRIEQQGGRRPIAAAAMNAAGPRNLGLRAGKTTNSGGEFSGLAVAYGRNGWKAGYGTKAFGKAGWAVQGWDDGGKPFEQSGFSFAKLERNYNNTNNNTMDADEPASKRLRH